MLIKLLQEVLIGNYVNVYLFTFIIIIIFCLKGVIWCDFKFSFLFGVLQADCA